MKTIYKLLLALGALLGMVALGLFWLVRGAFNVADHALDATANGVDTVVGAATKRFTAPFGEAELRTELWVNGSQ